jgi:hypothetical protein
MIKWEYLILQFTVHNNEYRLWDVNGVKQYDLDNSLGELEALNKFGEEGWELVTRSHDGFYTFHMKRPKA